MTSSISLVQDLISGLLGRRSWVQVLGRAEALPLSFISLGAGTAQQAISQGSKARIQAQNFLYARILQQVDTPGVSVASLSTLCSAGQGGQFVMTASVKGHLHNLARAALLGRYPILLQASGHTFPLGTICRHNTRMTLQSSQID